MKPFFFTCTKIDFTKNIHFYKRVLDIDNIDVLHWYGLIYCKYCKYIKYISK